MNVGSTLVESLCGNGSESWLILKSAMGFLQNIHDKRFFFKLIRKDAVIVKDQCYELIGETIPCKAVLRTLKVVIQILSASAKSF